MYDIYFTVGAQAEECVKRRRRIYTSLTRSTTMQVCLMHEKMSPICFFYIMLGRIKTRNIVFRYKVT